MADKQLPEWLSNFFDSNTWTFAKTMPKNPHEWLSMKSIPEQKEVFKKAAAYITENGYSLIWWRKTYTCLNYNGRRYWHMDDNPAVTTLINRAINHE